VRSSQGSALVLACAIAPSAVKDGKQEAPSISTLGLRDLPSLWARSADNRMQRLINMIRLRVFALLSLSVRWAVRGRILAVPEGRSVELDRSSSKDSRLAMAYGVVADRGGVCVGDCRSLHTRRIARRGSAASAYQHLHV